MKGELGLLGWRGLEHECLELVMLDIQQCDENDWQNIFTKRNMCELDQLMEYVKG